MHISGAHFLAQLEARGPWNLPACQRAVKGGVAFGESGAGFPLSSSARVTSPVVASISTSLVYHFS
jgi:hypothetical protein